MEEFTLPLSGKTLSIPSTGGDWQLYTSSMPCGRPAHALTAGLKRALKAVDKAAARGLALTIFNEREVEELVETYVRPVMTKWSAWGASDTEPRETAYSAILDAVSALER